MRRIRVARQIPFTVFSAEVPGLDFSLISTLPQTYDEPKRSITITSQSVSLSLTGTLTPQLAVLEIGIHL
ncbi:MAG: hypothetical protein DHS20C04_21620 [Hyphococcus sp.]|nr:MAG: hypothetical protein DHS20C04_21620 [Marinicaulis sp.]